MSKQISSNNYLATEEIINEMSVAVTLCDLAVANLHTLGELEPNTFELVDRGLEEIKTLVTDLKTWYGCISRGTEFDY